MSYTVKSKRWYGRFWLPERRKIKIMQALLDYQTPTIEAEVNKQMRDYLVYGIKPDTTTVNREDE